MGCQIHYCVQQASFVHDGKLCMEHCEPIRRQSLTRAHSKNRTIIIHRLIIR